MWREGLHDGRSYKCPKEGGQLWQENTSSSIPIYFMSSFMMHTHETKKLEILQKHFLWGIGDTQKLPNTVVKVEV